jgi:hypothetical protein
MAEVSRSGAARRTIFRHKLKQSTDRIARSDCNVAFCRSFVLYPTPAVDAVGILASFTDGL